MKPSTHYIALKHLLLLVSVVAMSVVACKKTAKENIVTPVNNYQRTDVGFNTVYAVDSTVYDNFTKTTVRYKYYIKVLNESVYTTTDTFPITRQLVYKSNYATDSFTVIQVQGLQYRNNFTIQLLNNQKQIVLNYPLVLNKVWNVNAENNSTPQNATLTAINTTYNYNAVSYGNVCTVTYQNDSNLITKNVAQYTYAPAIGLVYKQVTHLQSQTIKPNVPISLRATEGYSVVYNLVAHN
ncbi:MAG: hypothetical protein ABL940_04155 [Bacteroidia bacterium]